MANALFNRIAGNKPKYSAFNLSYARKFLANIGPLVPVCCDEAVPGDVWEIGCEAVVRSNPMVAPVLDEVGYKIHFFFVPYRLLDSNWEEFITGGKDGDDTSSLPTWSPSASSKRDISTLWDHLFGFAGVTPDADSLPIDYPRRAYLFVWNEYFRDQNLQPKIDWSQSPGTNQDYDGVALSHATWSHPDDDESFQYVSFEKDYFTSALPWRQRGTSPSLAITITSADTDVNFYNTSDATSRTLGTYTGAGNADRVGLTSNPSGSAAARFYDTDTGLVGASVDMNQLRLSLALQKFLELNARAGIRYKEFLQAHFGGTGYSDARLDRPEYIGGCAAPVIVSEVLQTAATDTGTSSQTVQGNMAGHGIQINSNRVGKYRVPEFGLILGLMSFRAKKTYHQGINRQWTRRSRYDFYFPEFAKLSEQAVLERELYVQSVKANNETTFGYSGAFDEMRVKYSMLHGSFRPGQDFDHWHLAYSFASRPTLSGAFIRQEQDVSVGERHLAVPSEPHFLVNYANIIRCIRPMPAIAEPSFGG